MPERTLMASEPRLIDLTHRIDALTLPYPGDPAPELRPLCAVHSDGFARTLASFTTHTGTHVDAPAHVLEGGRPLTDYSLEELCGAALLVDLRGLTGPIGPEALEGAEPCGWLLLCTGQSARWGTAEYFQNSPIFSEAFVRKAARLARRGLALDAAGLDREGVALHRLWFEAGGGPVVENLRAPERLLEDFAAGRALFFTAAPLKLDAADGAPVRAFVRVGN